MQAATAAPTAAVSITDFQRRVLEYPEEINLAILGGRGGGKSFLLGLIALRYAEQFRERARMCFIRRSYAGLRDFEDLTRELFALAYGPAARFNANDHTWRLPGGAFFELAQLDNHGDLGKFTGRSMGLILSDEAGQYGSPELLDLLRGNMRGRKGQPLRMVLAANPGNAGQTWLAKRFVLEHEPWKPFQNERGEWWVYCPSTYLDNPNIDQESYRRNLEAACVGDPELLKAWLEGSFLSKTGAYFGNCFDLKRNVIDPPRQVPLGPDGRRWRTHLGLDYGSAAPSVCYLIAESPGGKIGDAYFPRGSLIALDEYATHVKNDYSAGLNWTASRLGEALLEWCKVKWKVAPVGCADDACFARLGSSAGSIADELNRAGLQLSPAKKGSRVAGWERMRRLLSDAGRPDKPGLYLSRSCNYALSTLPFLSRDPRDPEDLDSSGPDHGADALRYGCLYAPPLVGFIEGLRWG